MMTYSISKIERMEQSNLLVDTITQKLLNDVSEWPDHLSKGCTVENIRKWLLGDNNNGWLNDNPQIKTEKEVETDDFFEWYDH